jgi:formylglycine-generating enzyme required for sulfatase activity
MASKTTPVLFSVSALGAFWVAVVALAAPVPLANKIEPGTVRRVEIADGVFMDFCYIPPGESRLGSGTVEERNAVRKAWKDEDAEFGDEPKWLKSEATDKRGSFKSKGFWLGKYEVTQEEWKAVMGTNPSFYSQARKKEFINRMLADVTNPAHLPVESVLARDCDDFIAKINKRPQLEKVFGKSAKFVVPHEDEWEYAYRGGKGNVWPFYWGTELNGTQANCNGDVPFGTEKRGPSLSRPREVDDTNMGRYAEHPWGLVHMSGNVSEWCECKAKPGRILCGGSLMDAAWNCRAASRSDGRKVEFLGCIYGFRVCVRVE